MLAAAFLLNLGIWAYVLWVASAPQVVEERLARYAGRPGALADIKKLSGSPIARLLAPLTARLQRGRRVRRRRRTYSEDEMVAAGIDPGRLDAIRYVAAGAVALPAGAFGLFVGGLPLALLLGAMGAGVGYVMPGIRVTQMLERRRMEILRQLPDTLDLVAVAMNAGLSFDHALSSISFIRDDPLSRLFRIYLEEVGFGRPSTEALLSLAQRSGVSEVRQLMAHVIQSRRYGASLVDVLRAQADYMRRILRVQQRERAGRASVAMLFPLILCIFPVTFLVTVAPIVIRFPRKRLAGGSDRAMSVDRAPTTATVELVVRDLYYVLSQKLTPLLLGALDREMARREVERFLVESPTYTESLVPDGRKVVVDRLTSELAGCGPLDPFLQDPDVTDIMVNRFDRVYIARAGRIELAGVRFWDEGHVRRIIERIAGWSGRRISHEHPVLDARLPDGSRAHAVLPPVAVDGAVLTIRKFLRKFFSHEELVRTGTLTVEMVEVLRVLVEDRANILIAGAPGAGKTTLLNVLGSFIPYDERIVTIEDVAELQLPTPNCVRLEASPGGSDAPETTIRDLLRAALRMRPDRIIVGEVRGPEALEMLQAMHSGHRGSYSTMHASGCRNALSRLEVLVLQAGVDYSVRAIREMIAQSVHMVIWMQQLPGGKRVAGEMSEVTGMEGDVLQVQPIFRYSLTRGRCEWTGIVPAIWAKLRESYTLPPVFERMQGRRGIA